MEFHEDEFDLSLCEEAHRTVGYARIVTPAKIYSKIGGKEADVVSVLPASTKVNVLREYSDYLFVSIILDGNCELVYVNRPHTTW